MARPEPSASRGELRAWLKTAVRSTMLDRVPPDYEPEGPGSGGPTRDHARDLLARLQALDPGTSPPDGVLSEIRAFRSWVEARLKTSRRLILGGASGDEGAVHRLGTEKRPAPRAEPTPARHPGPGPRPEHDPLWDRWLDG